jgi:hypothetical protein
MTHIVNQYPQFYQTNTEWALLNAGIEIRSGMFESATFDYTEVTFTLTLQRHSAIYEATIVIPALGECVCSLRIPENFRQHDVSVPKHCFSWEIILKFACFHQLFANN